MKKKLQNIAMQLSESEIQELVRIKKQGDKRLTSLHRKREKIAAQLAAVDAQIADIGGEKPAARKPRRAGRKPAAGKAAAKKKTAGRKPAKQTAKKAAKKKRGARINLSGAVREVFARAAAPLRAREVVEALPGVGVKVSDDAAMRKRISVVLASQKNHFEQVERGVYQLKDA